MKSATDRRKHVKTSIQRNAGFEVSNSQDFQDFKDDVKSEFKDIKIEIKALAKEFRDWKCMIDTQLTKLNMNMESVMKKLVDHESRLSTLEKESIESKGRTKGWFDAAAAVKYLVMAIAFIGAVAGSGFCLKLIGVFS